MAAKPLLCLYSFTRDAERASITRGGSLCKLFERIFNDTASDRNSVAVSSIHLLTRKRYCERKRNRIYTSDNINTIIWQRSRFQEWMAGRFSPVIKLFQAYLHVRIWRVRSLFAVPRTTSSTGNYILHSCVTASMRMRGRYVGEKTRARDHPVNVVMFHNTDVLWLPNDDTT